MKGFTIYEFRELGFIFYKARMDKGLTQEQLAEKFHLSKSSISGFEAGHFRRISFERLGKMARELDIDLKFCVIK